jgi:hypothetical protein
MQIKKTMKSNVFAIVVATTVAILLLVASTSANLVLAQSTNSINMKASMKPSTTNQSTKQFEVKTFEVSTTDKSICPAVTCTYTIENGLFRPNAIITSAYVLQGTIHASSSSSSTTSGGNTNSKVFPIRIDLINNGAQTTNGKTTEMLVGSFNFGSNVLAPHFKYKITNATLENAGTDNPILTLKATNAP